MKHAAIGFALLLGAPGAWAQDDLDPALDAMAQAAPGDAAAYVAARGRVLGMGSGILDALKRRGAADQWTADGWVRALCAESCRVRLAMPELAAAVDHPKGIDPAQYKQYRRPEPFCQAELRRRGTDAVPLLLERWRWTFDEVPFSAGPDGDAERAALRLAILAVPGELADLRASHFMKQALATGPDLWRATAAVSLGQCAGINALATLTACLDDAAQAVAVREACARALGRVPDQSALDAIRQRLAAIDEDASVRTGLLAALGLLGCDWAWEARGQAYAAVAPRIRQGCAETLVEQLRRDASSAETIGRALALVAWADSATALEAIAADASADNALRAGAQQALDQLKPALKRRK